jgi:arylsulfatase A-like enzyme
MSRKTNLLYIFADQWRAQGVGYANEDAVHTPNIDQFAKESMVFSNAVSTFPLCSPHRASLMTGKYPFNVGMWTNCKNGLDEVIMLKPQEVCIGNVLKDNGYHTGYIGKWHLDAAETNFHNKPKSGAVDWDAYTPPGERRQGFDYWLSYGADDNHLDPHYWADSDKQIRPKKWSVEYETDKALEYMSSRNQNEEPFALFLSYNPPHLPYELVPNELYERYKEEPVHFRENVPKEYQTEELKTITRQYFAAITGVDSQFKRIYDFLKENNMEENTLVVLSADHGEMLGSHGLMSKNIWYEEAIKIPLMIRKKGSIEQKTNDVIFASPDHMPTLLDLLDLPIPDTCQGYSHKNNMFGVSSKDPQHAFLCSYPGMPKMVKEFHKRGLNHKCFGWRGVRTKQYTYVINNGYAPDENQKILLYDNNQDPYQLNPTVIENRKQNELIIELDGYLKDYLEKTGDPFLLG